LGVESELVAGSNGIFDVIADGKKIYSRHDSGNFPAKGEIVALLKN
jgi:predicted Rdx family selenoprotein